MSLSRMLKAGALVAALLAAPATAAAHSKTDAVVKSRVDGTEIAISIYKPDAASAAAPAPVILHSHGWAGSRTSSDGAFQTELDRGYGVVSIDQRGHGASGGEANIEDPEFEGQDMISVIDHVAGLDWVAKDGPGDPVLFAMGGSYGGGYQFVAAFTELRDLGYTRLNAIAPEITWFNLAESLAPSKVVRSAWVTLLYAAGAANVPAYVHQAFAYGASTGQWPDGTVPAIPNLEDEFFQHGPSGHVAEGRRLDIPTLIGQGITDNLFNLNQGWKNFEQALTPAARERSLFVGYNGGHALPNVAPLGVGGGGDACSGEGGFSALRLKFFDAVLAGQDPSALLPAPYNMSTTTGECIRTERLDDRKAFRYRREMVPVDAALTPTGAGAAQQLKIAKGPLTVSGVPTLDAKVTTAGVDQRVFVGLSVGSDPLTASVVQNNLMPLRELTPVVGQKREIELPGVAVKVPEGQKLFLTITPFSDMYFGHGSTRTPGSVLFEEMTLNLPVVGAAGAGATAKKARKKAKRRAARRRG